MTKFAPIALLATIAALAVVPASVSAAETSQQVREPASAAAAAPVVGVSAGKMLYGPNGNRLGSVYRVTAAGDAQIILNSRLFTVPASTLSDVNGKVTTSLTSSDITRR